MATNISLFILSAVAVLAASALYNVARYKPAFLSSIYEPNSTYNAYLGVDGNYDGNFYHNSCYHTGVELTPWWMVDLRGQFSVVKIQITNRNDEAAVPKRLKNFEIDIFEDDPRKQTNFPNITGQLCYNQTTPVGQGIFNFTCTMPIVGRFVRLFLRLAVANALHTCEMEVLVSGSNFEEIYFSKSPNYKMSGTALAILTVRGQSACLQECLLRRSSIFCTALNWVPASGTCELFSVNPFIDLSSNLVATQGTFFFLQN